MSATTVIQGSCDGMAAGFISSTVAVEANKCVSFLCIRFSGTLAFISDLYCRLSCWVGKVMFQLTTHVGHVGWEDGKWCGGKEFCCFHGSRKFVIVLTRQRQLFLF